MSAWGRMLIFSPAIKAFTISHNIHIERRSVPYRDLPVTNTHTHKKHIVVSAQINHTIFIGVAGKQAILSEDEMQQINVGLEACLIGGSQLW